MSFPGQFIYCAIANRNGADQDEIYKDAICITHSCDDIRICSCDYCERHTK